MICYGIDPSVAVGKGTLVCTLHADNHATFTRCEDKSKRMVLRLRAIRFAVGTVTAQDGPVVLERPSGLQGSAQVLHGLYWLLADVLVEGRAPIYSIAPGTVKKFACGKGNGDKAQVATALTRQWGCCLPEGLDLDMDMADSFAMALLCRCAAGGENPNGKPWTLEQRECAGKVQEL